MMAQQIEENNPQPIPTASVSSVSKACHLAYTDTFNAALPLVNTAFDMNKVVAAAILYDNCVHRGRLAKLPPMDNVAPASPVLKLGNKFSDAFVTVNDKNISQIPVHVFFFYETDDLAERMKSFKTNCLSPVLFSVIDNPDGSYTFI